MNNFFKGRRLCYAHTSLVLPHLNSSVCALEHWPIQSLFKAVAKLKPSYSLAYILIFMNCCMCIHFECIIIDHYMQSLMSCAYLNRSRTETSTVRITFFVYILCMYICIPCTYYSYMLLTRSYNHIRSTHGIDTITVNHTL